MTWTSLRYSHESRTKMRDEWWECRGQWCQRPRICRVSETWYFCDPIALMRWSLNVLCTCFMKNINAGDDDLLANCYVTLCDSSACCLLTEFIAMMYNKWRPQLSIYRRRCTAVYCHHTVHVRQTHSTPAWPIDRLFYTLTPRVTGPSSICISSCLVAVTVVHVSVQQLRHATATNRHL